MPQNHPPKPSLGDAVHTLVKAGLSAVPVVGGPAAELFAAIIVPPLTHRRDQWVESIAEGLRQLEEQVQGFSAERLSENDSFVTTLLQASQAAVRNHEQEKLEALRNAVLNAAVQDAPEDTIQQIFIRLVDELTTWHLRILKFLDDPRAWGREHSVNYPNLYAGGTATVLEHAMPELQGRRDFYDLLVRDLHLRGLIGTDSLHGMMTSSGIFARRTTDLGRRLLNFIAAPGSVDT